MRLFSDESVDNRITLFLKSEGYNISSVHEHQTGISDDAVLKLAFDLSAILITEDRDFGYLVVQLNQNHKGVILYRIKNKTIAEKCEIVRNAIEKYANQLHGNFTVITAESVRIRYLKKEE